MARWIEEEWAQLRGQSWTAWLSLWISFTVRKNQFFPPLRYVREMSRCMRLCVSLEQPFCLQSWVKINAHSKPTYAKETVLSQPITEVCSEQMRSQFYVAVVLIKEHYWNIWPFILGHCDWWKLETLPFNGLVYNAYQIKFSNNNVAASMSWYSINCLSGFLHKKKALH